MIFDRNENKEVIVLLGVGSMRTAIVRRIAAGRNILLGDIGAEGSWLHGHLRLKKAGMGKRL